MARSARNTWLLLAGLAAILLLVVWIKPLGFFLRPAATSHAGVGKPMPALELLPLTTEASPVGLPDLAGRVTLVNFWGTWCPPCREELPHLAALAKRMAGQNDFRLLAVSCGSGADENVAELRASTLDFLSSAKLPIPAYADPGGQLRSALERQQAFRGMFPTTMAIDRRGVIRAVWEGYFPGIDSQMERVIASLLVEQTAGHSPQERAALLLRSSRHECSEALLAHSSEPQDASNGMMK